MKKRVKTVATQGFLKNRIFNHLFHQKSLISQEIRGFSYFFEAKSYITFLELPFDHIKYHSCDFPVTTSLYAHSPIFAYCVTDFDMPRRQSSGQNPAKWRLYCCHFVGNIFAKSQDIFLPNRRFFLNLTCPYAII